MRLAACRSDSSSASSEARNSAASSARRSVDQAGGRLDRWPRFGAGGSARMRARMNACFAANASLTGGSSAVSVAASASSSSFRAYGGSICRKPSSGRLLTRKTAARRQWSRSLSTWELTQPSLSRPAAL